MRQLITQEQVWLATVSDYTLRQIITGASLIAAKAMKTLVEFMAINKALASCSKTLTIFGQAFHSIEAFAPVLQVSHSRRMSLYYVYRI